MMSVPGIICEYKFHPDRRWKFDYYDPKTNRAYEYEGIFSMKSRHTSLRGYTADTEKYNEAANMGIMVFRFTALNYKSVLNYI